MHQKKYCVIYEAEYVKYFVIMMQNIWRISDFFAYSCERNILKFDTKRAFLTMNDVMFDQFCFLNKIQQKDKKRNKASKEVFSDL